MVKVAINGFGRIGRLFFRQAFGEKNINIVAVNDLGSVENLAYLLKHDSVYGTFEKSVKVQGKNLVVGGKKIECLRVKEPRKLPWKKMGVDIVVEATGVFDSFAMSKDHLKAGAKRVVITAPTDDADGKDGATVLMGVNDGKLKSIKLSSNASCTTNAASPVIAILSEKLGIEKAMLSTVHGYTASQALVDGPVRGHDLRRGRAAAYNIVPSTTGAAEAVERALPGLAGKFDGIAFRVPVIAGSIADITLVSKRNTSVKEVNTILKKAAGSSRWKGIMAVTEDPVVSSDIVGQPYGAIVDLPLTRVVGGNLVKVLSWYDNEYGYASTLVKHVNRAGKYLK
ncbi:MAG: Glyceraldehyde-3-phosphate dehydrogenase [Parcubacteria group bacterium GW2011_GWA1_47_11]|uniref:Type I glyceraldehyde-3-phosphate dehydrogenase n=1 Tax=Candidatus Colwellbacteria bacterium GWA2_46_10 TaxID=1797684 RepID=A0A1G1YUP4_9BACT|nr:MAG: Glyceraldehyde-3-phosphate dehydrogenase [Parcubacteria group bacterium GW2011_GWA2_46_10]KKU55990.1 MAG: Glyceraldehyde-3-phosphate dehydrogenase [Parcubacteria group bacterium GW2011_GWA1_47_11]OGY56118.1 MAG: type I glyceraldehyde-3-phosphate dehydrogenase [Candidatus Colwellbacteria bacterium GWA2_46_10]